MPARRRLSQLSHATCPSEWQKVAGPIFDEGCDADAELTGVDDRVDVLSLHFGEQTASLRCWQGDHPNSASFGLGVDVCGDRQPAIGARPDDEPMAAPRDGLRGLQRRVPEPVTERL